MCETACTNKTFSASGGRGMSVRAPHSSSLLTASMSAAMMAKKITGIGIRDMLGSAPRSSSSFSVFRRTRCLVRQEHNTLRSLHRNTQPDHRDRAVNRKKMELTRFSWQPSCERFHLCQRTDESRRDSALRLSAASLPLSPGC